MLKIYINLGGKWDDYPECPLRSDLNTCGACQDSKINKINSCPQLDDEGEKYTVPDWCPVKNGGVEILPKPLDIQQII